MHFNFKQGLFQAKGEILQYISEDGKEYVPYDYNFEEDIVPAINNLIPGNETLPIQRELKNIKVFLQGSLVGLCFKGFDRCVFNENSRLNMWRFNGSGNVGLYHLEIRNCLFKGIVNFDESIVPEKKCVGIPDLLP